MPLGLTFLLAMPLAMVCASLVKSRAGGNVDTVFTSRTHFFFLASAALLHHKEHQGHKEDAPPSLFSFVPFVVKECRLNAKKKQAHGWALPWA